MSANKKIAAVVLTTVALSVGTVGVASASPTKSDAKSVTAHQANKGANRAAHQALIALTIGKSTAEIQTGLAAGQSLGAIAGDKRAALITALVADKTKSIDGAVAAGKMTATQATTLKAGLSAHVTAHVDAVRPAMGPGMGKGGHKGGHGPNH